MTRTRRWRDSRSTVTTYRGRRRQGWNRGGTFVVDLRDLMANVLAPTTAGGVAARDLNAIRSQSVASILCIVVSEPVPLIPTSEPAQLERSGPGPGLMRTRERLKHPAGRGPLSEETTQASLGAGSWTREREGMGNVRVHCSRFFLPGLECVRSARATKVSSWYCRRMRDCRPRTSLNEGQQTCQ